MVGVTVFAADQTERAEYLATSHYQRFLGLIRNTPGKLKAPVDSMDGLWSPYEKAMVDEQLSSTIIGDKEKVKTELEAFIEATQADEVMINSDMFDHQERMRSYEIIGEIFQEAQEK